MRRHVVLAASAAFALTLGVSACNGTASDNAAGLALGTDGVSGQPQPLPEAPTQGTGQNGNVNADPAPTPTATPPASTAAFGPTCTGAGGICLALKSVVYTNSAGVPVVSDPDALANLTTINEIWSQCGIAFEYGEYVKVNPVDQGLGLNTSTLGELSTIRNQFENNSTLLVVTTGAWSGSLGSGAANAWTNMPGSGTYGVVLEEPVGSFGNIIAHELGHYLNLDHMADTSDVMNAEIYQGSTRLTTSQCSAAKAAATSYWTAMQR